MALFKLPLSGDVVQWINPVTWFASGNQISTNVYLGESSSPETEAEILEYLFAAAMAHIAGERDDLTALVIHALD